MDLNRIFKNVMPTKIVLLYVAVSSAWIFLGQWLLPSSLTDAKCVLQNSTISALLFVLVTAGLLFFVLCRYFKICSAREAELKQSEESLMCVLAGSQLGFWDWNIAGNEVKRNAIWAQMLGYAYDEIDFTTQQWTDFIHPDDRKPAWDSIYAVLAGRGGRQHRHYPVSTGR